jgi:hypothetical protein
MTEPVIESLFQLHTVGERCTYVIGLWFVI